MRPRLLFFLCVCISQILRSSPIIVDLKTEGVSNSVVNCIARDKQGFVWIGTNSGLYRFDGYHFKEYSYKKDDSASFWGNLVYNIAFDQKDQLWIGTDSGVCCFAPKMQTFTRYNLGHDFASWGMKMLCDSRNNLWFGVSSGVYRFDAKANKFIYYPQSTSGYGEGGVACFYEDQQKNLWVSNWNGGLSRYIADSDKFQNYPLDENSKGLTVRGMTQASDGRIWLMGFKGELYTFESGKYIIKDAHFFAPNLKTRFCLEDKQGNLWMANLHYLIKFNPLTNEKEVLQLNYTNSIIVCPIISGMMDKTDDILWIGTDNGLKKIILKSWATNYVRDQSLEKSRLQNAEWIDDQHYVLWGWENFIYDMKGSKKQFKGSFQKMKVGGGEVFMYNENESIFYYFDKLLGEIKQKNFIPVDSMNNQYKDFHILDNGDRLLESHTKNIFYHNSKNKKNLELKSYLKIPEKKILGLYLTGDTLLLAFEKKIYYWNINDNFISRTMNVPLRAPRWINLTQNVAWIYNMDSIYCMPLNNKISFSAYPYPYKDEAIKRIIDNKNRLWLTFFTNLYCIDPHKKKNESFKMDRLISYHPAFFSINSKNKMLIGGDYNYMICDADTFLATSSKSTLRLSRLIINGQEMRPSKGGIIEQDIYYTRQIFLKPSMSTIGIEFASDEYIFPESIIYEYKLEGLEAIWTTCSDGTNYAKYNKLPAGDYTLRIRKEHDPSTEITLNIVVFPYWWQSWWFIMIMIIVILFLGIAYSRYRTFRVREKNKLLEKMVEERTLTIREQNDQLQVQTATLLEQREEMQALNEELRAQSEELYYTNEQLQKLNATKDRFFSIIAHDLKNPFNAVLGLSEIMVIKKEETSPEIHEMAVHINESSKLIFSLLQNLLEWAKSQLNSTKFEPENFILNDIINPTIDVLQLNAANKKIHLVNECPDSIAVFADKNMITTVIRNLITNAIKFTPVNGKITVNAVSKNTTIEVSVTDTGVGMSQEIINKLFQIDSHHTTSGTSGEMGTGLGLIICKDFVVKNGGLISVSSAPGKGSTFTFTLPVKK